MNHNMNQFNERGQSPNKPLNRKGGHKGKEKDTFKTYVITPKRGSLDGIQRRWIKSSKKEDTSFELFKLSTTQQNALQLEVTHLARPGKGILDITQDIAILKNITPTTLTKPDNYGETDTFFRFYSGCAQLLWNHVSGFLLSEAVLKTKSCRSWSHHFNNNAIHFGVILDTTKTYLNHLEEPILSEDLDALECKMAYFKEEHMSFVLWEAKFKISFETPSTLAVEENCKILAYFATTAQKAGLVPILSIGVDIDGERCSHAMSSYNIEIILKTLTTTLKQYSTYIEGLIIRLKASSIAPDEVMNAYSKLETDTPNVNTLSNKRNYLFNKKSVVSLRPIDQFLNKSEDITTPASMNNYRRTTIVDDTEYKVKTVRMLQEVTNTRRHKALHDEGYDERKETIFRLYKMPSNLHFEDIHNSQDSSIHDQLTFPRVCQMRSKIELHSSNDHPRTDPRTPTRIRNTCTVDKLSMLKDALTQDNTINPKAKITNESLISGTGSSKMLSETEQTSSSGRITVHSDKHIHMPCCQYITPIHVADPRTTRASLRARATSVAISRTLPPHLGGLMLAEEGDLEVSTDLLNELNRLPLPGWQRHISFCFSRVFLEGVIDKWASLHVWPPRVLTPPSKQEKFSYVRDLLVKNVKQCGSATMGAWNGPNRNLLFSKVRSDRPF